MLTEYVERIYGVAVILLWLLTVSVILGMIYAAAMGA